LVGFNDGNHEGSFDCFMLGVIVGFAVGSDVGNILG